MTTPEISPAGPALGGLEALGWDPSSPPVRDALPTVLRGHNLVILAPPAPVHAAPALAGLLQRQVEADEGLTLVLAPQASIAEWAVPVAALAGRNSHPLIVLGPSQPTRRLQHEPRCDVLIAAPDAALELHRRSLLPGESIRALLIAWPETWEDQEVLTLLLQDVSREAQRIVLTAAPDRIAALLERHVWRALTVGETFVPDIPEVRVVPVPWSRRIAALPELAERLDVASLAVWTADRSRTVEIERAMAAVGVPVEVTTGEPAPAGAIIAFDLPPASRLARLAALGSVSLLQPPGTEPWVTRIAPARRPLLLAGALHAAAEDTARRRRLIERAVREEPLGDTLVALAPLFEHHDPAAVAAALYQLWTREADRPAKGPEPLPSRGVARVWVGAGKRDDVGPNDLVGLLVNELKVDRSQIGRIDLRESFALIEVPADAAERIAEALAGRTVKRRRLTARVDRGTERKPQRGRRG